MSLASEFKEFAMKGSVVDLAIGVIIGAAFGKIVSSLVGDIFMPILGKAIGGINFSDLAMSLGKDPAGKDVLVKYGCVPADGVRFPGDRAGSVRGHQGTQYAQEATGRRGCAAAAAAAAGIAARRRFATCSQSDRRVAGERRGTLWDCSTGYWAASWAPK